MSDNDPYDNLRRTGIEVPAALDRAMCPRDKESENALMREWTVIAGRPDAAEVRDAMASEWEVMLGNGGDANQEPREPARVLNQNEIDSLLGFGDHPARGEIDPVEFTGWICPGCGRGVRQNVKFCDHGGIE